MERLISTPVFNFNPNQLNEVRALNGYENKKQISEAIDTLDDWIKKQNHFTIKDFNRDYLERLIIYNKGSVERAKQRLDRTCTLRNLIPELMSNIDIGNEFEDFLKLTHVCMFPKPTKDNYRIYYISVIKPEECYDIKILFRYMHWMIQYKFFSDYCAGIEGIIDLREFSFSMLNMLNPTDTQKGIMMLLQTYGSRIKGFHVIISNRVIEGAITLVKKFLSDKLKKRVYVHSSYESVYEVVDKSVLPVDIGGEYKKTVKELSDGLFKELCSKSNLERIKYLDRAVTIESQRLNSTFNEEYSGMPGSFKTLSVD